MNQEPEFNTEPVENIAEALPSAQKKKSELIHGLFDYVEMFAWTVFVMMMLFTFVFRVCQVDGGSMENTLHDKEYLLVTSFAYTPKQDDIVVFHTEDTVGNSEKILIKRVIATGGQTVKIDFINNEIYVDGVLYKDSHAVLKNYHTNEITDKYTLFADYNYDSRTGTFIAEIPADKVFVLGDNRNNSKDSRSSSVGMVDERLVLGKVIFRLSPLTVFS